jgi:transposase
LQAQATPEQEREGLEVLPEEKHPPRSRSVKQASEARRAQKHDRYEQVVALHHQGVKPVKIASRMGIGERTVWRWLSHGSFPEARRRRRRPSLIDPYERYVLTRWQEGCRNGLQLHRELRAQGYKGSPRALYSYLATLRTPQSLPSKSLSSKQKKRKSTSTLPAPLENFSAQRATWLFVSQPDDLDETSLAELILLRRASPRVETAYHLTQTFMRMIRERTGGIYLKTWLQEAEVCDLPEFQSFARGIHQDKEAVLAGLTLPWSNGPTEGHVNRLKLLKRSMYGRAKLPLLRARVLHVA